ncbi:Gfo/Idh/MocA family oxidoreductase [Paenibacillus sp. HB172176]|uniref:Gfo/Idh/MocA family protein n=1 Tax=Paenibacillus sp. HB172176 TaxID=2493690 RepID=UPI00143BBB90|nr:Gfo/Idh/MocA family oxidoreductase [Paenibacillus sp. HB172176]
MKTYKLGVIGLGEGRSIMSAALSSKRWELTKVCDLNQSLCEHRAEEFGFDNWTTDYSELLSDPEIDAVAIYTPDQLHLAHIIQALEAGKHVICTKPMLTSLEGSKELLEAVRKSGRRVFVGQSSRFFEPMIHQRADFEQGRHGDVQTVEAHYISDSRWFLDKPWSRQRGFSWMYNFMIHAVDLVRWYLPDAAEVTGFGNVSENSRVYGLYTWDSMRLLVRDDKGRIGQISGSYTMPALGSEVEPGIGCVIRGTKGSSRAEYSNLRYHTHFAGEGRVTHSFEDKHDYYFRFEGKSHHAGEYQNYIEYFADCLDNNIKPLPDAEEALQTLALMAAMERSMKEGGKLVRIGDILREHDLKH